MESNFKISSFWSRVLAFLIDTMIIGISGFILGLIFESQLIKIGNYGIFIGLIISVAYFTILNSKITNGQTIGKKVVGIQTVDLKGNGINIDKSLYRSLILFVPYFTVNYSIPSIPEGSVIGLIKTICLSSILIAVVFIFILNSGNRRSLHDIIVGSIVISKIRQETYSPIPDFSKSSFYLVGAFIIFMIGIILYLFSSKNSSFSEILPVYTKLSNLDGVFKVGVSKNKQTFYGKETTTTNYYFVSLWVVRYPDNQIEIENSDIVKESIKVVLDNESNPGQFDYITIQLIKGFDIGISRKTTSHSLRKSPEDWGNFLK